MGRTRVRLLGVSVAALLASWITPATAQAEPPKYDDFESAVAAGAVAPDLAAALEANPGGVDVIVQLDRRPAEAAAQAVAGAPVSRRIEAYGRALGSARDRVGSAARVRFDLPWLSVVAVHVGSTGELLAVVNQLGVESASLDHQLEPAIQQALPQVNQPEVVAAGITGAGTAVSVIDTGADYLRQDFGTCASGPGTAGCRVLVSEDVAPPDGIRDDAVLHGTRVAAIVAATAPGTSLLVYDVFNGDLASSSWMAIALNRTIDRKHSGIDIRAVNLSVSSNPPVNCDVAHGDFGLADATNAGILPVVAAGNSGGTDHVPWPGCLPAALSVGAVWDTAGADDGCGPFLVDDVACFSSSGPELDLLAPGAAITVSGLPAVLGTSFAAPFVAGAAAILADASPVADVASIRTALVESGPLITDRRSQLVRHRLDIADACLHLTGSCSGGWLSLGGVIVGDPDLAAWGGGRVDLFARGADDQLWHRFWDGTQFSGWEPLGGRLTSAPTVVAWGPNRLDVFARGTDSAMWHRFWDGSAWSGWERLGGVLASAPEAASWVAGRLDVFARGADDQLWHRWWDGTQWNGWEPLGGGLGGAPGAASWAPGRLDVFARGTDGQLWHRYFESGWSAWEALGGGVAGDVDAASAGLGSLDVFVQANDSQLWRRRFAGSWQAWTTVGGPAVGSGPGADDHGRGLIDLSVRAPDGALWYRVLDS